MNVVYINDVTVEDEVTGLRTVVSKTTLPLYYICDTQGARGCADSYTDALNVKARLRCSGLKNLYIIKHF